MTDSGLHPLLLETATLLRPLRDALTDHERFLLFLERFGYAPDADAVEAGFDGLTELRDTLEDVVDVVADLPPRDELGAADLVPLGAPVASALRQVRDIASAIDTVTDLDLDDEFAREVLDVLLHDHLRARAPITIDLLRALGVLETTAWSAEDGDRDVDAALPRFRWARLRTLVEDGGTWAAEVYGWGEDFEPDLAITRIVAVLDWVGPFATLEPMSDEHTAAFVDGHPPDRPNPLRAAAALVGIEIDDHDLADGADAFAEAGLALLPFGDLTRPAELGLATAPYVEGSASLPTELTDRLTLTLDVDADAIGGAVLALTPEGLRVEGDGDASASFELGVRFARPDQPVVLVGSPDGTRVQIDAALLSLGGSLDGDLFLAGGVEQLRAVIDLSEDGFLGSLISDPLTLDAGDVLAGWRPGRGIYFEGGTNLAIAIPLEVDLGPLRIHELELTLGLEQPSLSLAVTADASIGPLFAYVEGLGLRAALVPAVDGDGVLGDYDIALSLVPPSGYALELDADGISGGGMLARTDDGYRGALALRFGEIGFSAFGLLATDVPDSDVRFSFVASVFGEFSLPLGFGFFLTGLGGIIGIHRTVDTGALREVLYEGRLDDQLFPDDPIANADTILDDMAAIYPVSEGDHLFGPVARISWGQPALIDLTLGVVVEFGGDLRIVILGSMVSVLPDRDAALVELRLAFFGEIDFADETIAFDATLQGSRVLTYGISGEMALRSGWAPGIDHVVSFGGLHPDYPKPDDLPDLQRLGVCFGRNNPKVSLRAYLAITLNSFQFGARVTAYFEGPKVRFVGQVAVEGNIYFDALLYFNPFAFDVALGGSLELLVDGAPQLEVAFDLRLRGPNEFTIDGKAWARVFKIKVSVPIKHRWGDRESLAGVRTDPVAILVADLEDGDGFVGTASRARTSGVSFRSLDGGTRPADPAGGLRLQQRALPLATEIEKVGEAKVSGGAARFDLHLADDAGLAVDEVTDTFARGQFLELSESERLRTPSFDRHKAGLQLAADALSADTDAAIEAEHAYEVIVIGSDDEPADATPRIVRMADLTERFVARFASTDIAAIATPRTRRRIAADDAVHLDDPVHGPPPASPGVDGGAVEEPATVGGRAVAVHHGQPAYANYVMMAGVGA